MSAPVVSAASPVVPGSVGSHSDVGPAATSASLPLHFRLPNAPQPFVGRRAETRALQAALLRAPVVLVSGPTGSGKSSFVRHALRDADPEGVLHIELASRLCPEIVLDDLVRTLSVAGTAATTCTELGMLTAVVDAVDRDAWVVVLDDGEEVTAAFLERVVHAASRYLRSAQCIVVIDSDGVDLEVLNRMCALPGVEHVSLSPLPVPVVDADPAFDAVLHTGDQLIATLALAGGRLSHALLAALASFEVEALFARWLELGAVSCADGHWVLDPALARLLATCTPLDAEQSDAMAARCARVVADLESQQVMDAVRVLSGLGALPQLLATLDGFGRDLLDLGLARELDEALGLLPGEHDGLGLWRMRCHADLGDGAAGAALVARAALRQTDPDAQVAAAQALVFRGAFDDAIQHSEQALAVSVPGADRGAQWRARFQGALARVASGMPDLALRLLRDIAPSRGVAAVLTDVLRAVTMVDAGQSERALELAGNVVESRLAGLTGPAAVLATTGVAAILRAHHRLHEAMAMMEGPQLRDGLDRSPAMAQALALTLRCVLAIDLGHFEAARADSEALSALSDTSALVLDMGRLCAGGVAIGLGDLARLRQIVAQPRPRGRWDLAQGHTVLALHLALLDANPMPPEASVQTHQDAGLDDMASRLRANTLTWQVRWLPLEELPDEASLRSTANANAPKAQRGVERRVARARARRGDLRAVAVMQASVEAARNSDIVLDVLLALEASCECALLLGDRVWLAQASAAFVRVALESTARFSDEARFYAALASNTLTPGLLQALATGAGPVAARRARALLGLPARLDAIDAAIVDGARAPVGRVLLDRAARTLVMADSAAVCVDLSSSEVLWLLVEALVDNPTGACKEALVEAVWAPAEYHPLHHDNKLRLAVRRLRGLLERVPGLDLETTEDGYRWVGLDVCGG